jgi:hypothetical protein
MNPEDFLKRLIELIVDAFKDDEFGMLLSDNLYKVPKADFDYAGLSPNLSYRQKVRETVLWVNRFGQLKLVLWLAQTVYQEREMRDDLKEFVRDLETVLQPKAPAPQANASSAPLPPALVATLGFYRPQQDSLEDLVRDLRPKLRAENYRPFDLPGRFHLSESEAERLVAVLALEAEPDAGYLRWLSERVTVERPYSGFIAAQALIGAGLWLKHEFLARLGSAARSAVDRLDRQMEVDLPPSMAAFDAARKGELDVVLSLVRMRSQGQPAFLVPDELDAFLKALMSFSAPQLEVLCEKRLGTNLRLMVRIADPIEHIIATLSVAARKMRWELKLLQAACQERPADPTFSSLCQKYGAAPVV